ncbi:MAG: restriction endonuclease subunit S [Candidatus Methanogasteraceae archaeon]
MSSGLVLVAEGGRWKQYPAYRDSGVEWLGAVPEGWSAVAVKHHFNIQLGKMLQNKPDSDADILIPYAKALHVLWGSVITDDLPEMWAKPSDIQQYGIRGDDLLVCEGGEVGRAGVVTSPPEQCIIQNALHRVRAKKSSDVQFLGYVLHAVNSSTWFDVLCNKATIAHFTREKCADLRIPVPPLPEQHAIAAFLDRETGRIDALVAKKGR